jgi:hypothetical protein
MIRIPRSFPLVFKDIRNVHLSVYPLTGRAATRARNHKSVR